MGKKSRTKGYNMENENRIAFNASDIHCIRVPLSGGGSIKGDLQIYPGKPWQLTAECKIKASGFRQIYSYLDNADFAIIRADRKQSVACVPMRLFLEMCKAWGDEKLRQRELENEYWSDKFDVLNTPTE